MSLEGTIIVALVSMLLGVIVGVVISRPRHPLL